MDKTKNSERMKRYRKTHRRFDYVPSPEVLAVIELERKNNPKVCFAEILDRLIIAGRHYRKQ